MEDKKLMDCPFCGKAPVWGGQNGTTKGTSIRRRYIKCKKCGCRTQASVDNRRSIEAWNTRAHVAQQPVTVAEQEAAVADAMMRSAVIMCPPPDSLGWLTLARAAIAARPKTVSFADLFLASGGVLDFTNSDITINAECATGLGPAAACPVCNPPAHASRKEWE